MDFILSVLIFVYFLNDPFFGPNLYALFYNWCFPDLISTFF